MKAYRNRSTHLLYPLIQGISSGEGGCPSSANYTGCAIGRVASGNVVTVQDHILIKLDEKCFNYVLSLQEFNMNSSLTSSSTGSYKRQARNIYM